MAAKPAAKPNNKRGGGERRAGVDRRHVGAGSSRRRVAVGASTVATLTTYAAAAVTRRWDIPPEIAAIAVGLVFGEFALIYHRVVLPWMK